ncbi:MAG: family 78 glycoside hydrolase catalytic domain [Bacteroidota bacterium]|nr:family 78 glycoside hydrolase catalytic domain [Bacteroidota bacterium]
MNLLRAVLFFFCEALLIQSFGQNLCKPVDLRCEYRSNPLGLDVTQPRLSWRINDDRRGASQTAYRILVASDSLLLSTGKADVWDSGKKHSSLTSSILYNGRPLQPDKRYFWTVIVWDKNGRPTVSSTIAYWNTGLFGLKDWKGNWIDDGQDINYKPAPYFRKTFSVKKKVKRALAYICGLGYYELSLNGKKAGDHMLDPGYTRFDKTALYASYDVSSLLKEGENAIGVILGNGWYNEQSKAVWYFDKAPWRNRPRFLFNLSIEYENGEKEIICTDPSWKVGTGPIVFNNIYSGEKYDARLEQVGWNTMGFDDHSWKQATAILPHEGRIKSQLMPPIRITAELKPKTFIKINSTTYLYDLGQNFAGVSKLHVKGESGTVLRIKHGERLDAKGRLDNQIINQYYSFEDPEEQGQTDIYILKGEGEEEYTPRFTYHGFRYVEITSDKPVELNKEDLEGMVMHTDLTPLGNFECSNPLENAIWSATNWSYLSNLFSIPTDCPHREKNGWTGDGHIAAEFGLFNYDGILFYEKWINDFADEQRNSGEVPGIIPSSGWGYSWGNGPAWDSGLLLIPWYLYQYYGDEDLIRLHYENYKRYVDFLTYRSKDNLVDIGLGDWVPWKTETPVELTSSCYYYMDALLLSKFSGMTGRTEEESYYKKLATKIKDAINRKYFNREKGIYVNGSQTALSAALYFGIVPEEMQEKVGLSLAQSVKDNGNSLDVGLLGSKYLLNALSNTGHSDLAYLVASKDTQPSWGWWIKNGATTLHEDWKSESSLNHIMMGEVSAWMMRTLAGINIDPANPGFKNIIIKPRFVSGLNHAKGSMNSIHGEIVSEWTKDGDMIILNLRIPANTTAVLYLPETAGRQIFEGEKLLGAKSIKGIQFLSKAEGCLVYRIAAGTYSFKMK